MSDLLPQDVHPAVQQAIKEISAKAATPTHPVMAVAPKLAQVPQGGFVHANVSGTQYIYTNVNGVLYKAALVPA